ncbi:MAG: acetoacetate decarboxylase family protein [Actinomycetota bacterium]|nr:acetoacetate decarboxylase family protein [Actinomycetota bacterium]
MSKIRYAARSDEERRNRELEATKGEIWSQALTAIYETDPEIIAAVLPPPLEPPAEPLVRATITTVDMPGGYTFGAGYFAVRAKHEGLEGEYPLFMPMTTEQATVGGRETFGEPKKIGEVWVKRDGADVHGVMARMGFTVVEIQGRVAETLESPPERTKTDFYFKFLPAPDGLGVGGGGFDSDPALVYCHKKEKMRLLERVDGDLVLRDSPLDPVADIPVRRLVDLNWSERTTFQSGVIHSYVKSEWLAPFVHQRYDDMSVLGKRT